MLLFELKPSPWDDKSDDIFTYALDNIARDVEFHLKSRLDTGINPDMANRSRKVTVRNEMGQLVIEEREPDIQENLFMPSTQPPSRVDDRIIFRQVKGEEITGQQKNAIKSSVRDAMTFKFRQYLEDGSKKIRSEEMGIK